MAQLQKTLKPTDKHTARWATVLLIAFMLALQWIPDSAILATYMRVWLPDVLLLYMTVEVYETSQQSWTNLTEFFWDNGLSLLGMLVGVGIFILLFGRESYMLGFEQVTVIRWCMLACAFDFFLGLAIVFRITSAGREREETITHT